MNTINNTAGHKVWLLLLTLCLSLLAKSQDTEVGGFLGGANYFGDLNPDYKFGSINIAAGGLYRYTFNDYWLIKTSFLYGRIGFDDKAYDNAWQQARNLQFSSYIFELSQQVEFNFFAYNKREDHKNFTPYMLAGISLFQFKPQAQFNGTTYELRSYGTEGQNTPAEFRPRSYSYTQLAFPIGGGIKYSLNAHWNLNIEVAIRKTSTDYLDDVSDTYPDEYLIRRYNNENPDLSLALSDRSGTNSEQRLGATPGKQRGEAYNNDDYLFMGVMITYTFWDILCPYNATYVEF